MIDTTGKIFLGIAIVSIVCAVISFYFLSKKGPRGAVLGVAAVIYFVGISIPTGNIRELHLIAGVLKLTGFIGGILGLVDLFKGGSRTNPAEVPVEAEIVDETEDHDWHG
jgi:hypothetical protein